MPRRTLILRKLDGTLLFGNGSAGGGGASGPSLNPAPPLQLAAAAAWAPAGGPVVRASLDAPSPTRPLRAIASASYDVQDDQSRSVAPEPRAAGGSAADSEAIVASLSWSR